MIFIVEEKYLLIIFILFVIKLFVIINLSINHKLIQCFAILRN